MFTLRAGDTPVKVFQVIWPRGEIGVYVSVPYFTPLHALVGRVEVPPGPAGPVTISLREGARVSLEKIKMSFHQSGNARISATQRITPVVLDAEPLVGKVGHLFTIHQRGPDALGRVTDEDRAKRPERLMLVDLPADVAAYGALKVVGYWYPLASVVVSRPAHDPQVAPGFAHIEVSEGVFLDGVLIAPPTSWRGREYCLFIAYSPFDDPSRLQQPYALLRGAFTPCIEPETGQLGTRFLSVMYTNREAELDELTGTLGTIDLNDPTS